MQEFEEIIQPLPEEEEIQPLGFDEDLIKKYPRSNRKVTVGISPYSIATPQDEVIKGHTLFISPFGLEFQGAGEYPEGTLLKIHVTLPNYWQRKQKYVEYQRVDTPQQFKILAKVLKAEDVGKRGKKKLVLAQTVNIDEIDEEVLKSYLQDG